jgi:hypothetical protein
MFPIFRGFIVFLSVLFCLGQAPAQAGQLFPPDNEASCSPGTVLIWNAQKGSVDCVPALSNITVQCAANQVLVSFQGDSSDPTQNHTSCLTLPQCASNQFLTFSNGQFSCAGLNIPACQNNTTLNYANGAFSCQPLSLPACRTGQYLTSTDGATFVCSSLDTCTPNWTNVSVGPCSAACGGGVASILQSDGCGHNQTINQACNTQTCQPIVSVFTTPGTYTWTKPNVNYSTATIECWGGGGSGRTISYCGGGGGGGYSVATVALSSLPDTVTGVVGAGGAQNTGCWACDGIAGGASSFGSIVYAPGGAGGQSGNASGGPGGGTGEDWNGIIDKNAYGGGGGGGAGSADAGNPGGSSYLNGQPYIGGQGGYEGQPGQQPGGGGGSCVGFTSASTQWGGAGGNGECRVTVMP